MITKIAIGLIGAGTVMLASKLPRAARPDTFSFLIKMAVSGIFYIILRSLTAGWGVLQPKMIADAASNAGSELSSK